MSWGHLMPVLGHELRTPLAAILGYQELLADGIYGKLDDAMKEPIERIQHSAQQLLHLIDGFQELATTGTGDHDERSTANSQELLQQVVLSARPFAAGRTVDIVADSADAHELVGLPLSRFLRAADLALVAAIKNSTGRTLPISLTLREGAAVFTIDGTGLDPANDDPATQANPLDSDQPLSAARLRLAMAAATLAITQGSMRLTPTPAGTRVALTVPLAPERVNE